MTIDSECMVKERSSAVPRALVTVQMIKRLSMCDACGDDDEMDIGYELPCAVHQAHIPFFRTLAVHPTRESAAATAGAASTPPVPTTATGMVKSNPASSNNRFNFSSSTFTMLAYGTFFAPGM